MTRRGSVAYYLAAVVCGTFFMTLGLWLPRGAEGTHWTPSTRGVAGFLLAYCIGIVIGTIPALLFAFLLRRAMGAWRAGSLWSWVVAGAGLALLEIWGLAKTGNALRLTAGNFPRVPERLLRLLLFAVAGPAMAWDAKAWLAIPVGAMTALVLYLIHHAFAPRAAPAES